MSAAYVSLHQHSTSSTLDGISKPESIARYAAELKMSATALTDHGVLSGLPEFHTACREVGIKPILGMEAYTCPDRHKHETFVSPSGRTMRTGYHLVLLAKNLTGYKNLLRLHNIGFLEGHYFSPKIDWDALVRHKEGLIVTSACPSGELAQHALSDQDPRIVADRFRSVFKQDYAIEVQDNNMANDLQRNINRRVLKVAKDTGIMVIPTNDAHYLRETDQGVHDVAVTMQIKKVLSDPKRMKYDGVYHLKSPAEMERVFPEFMNNTLVLADMVENYDLADGTMYLPSRAGDENGVLELVAKAGLEDRGLDRSPYRERLTHELAVIKKLRLASYLLTTREIVDLIRDMKCPLGWGRGSGAGSLVCYVLRITDVDPIKYGLLFERFINEYRPDWPDIDIDLAQGFRDRVIARLLERYGRNNVAHITTTSTLKPKALLRDILRVMEESKETVERLVAMAPESVEVTRQDLEESELWKHLAKTQQGQQIQAIMTTLFGAPRHSGVHASGLVISSVPIADHLPVRMVGKAQEEQKLVVQYAMEFKIGEGKKAVKHSVLDKMGFLKFDILGVTKLDIVAQTAADVDVDLKSIPDNDVKAFDLLGAGKVAGVFQLDASSMGADLAQKMKPRTIDDIAVLIAIMRPGVSEAGLLGTYLARRSGSEAPQYVHPDLQAVLEDTYGICVFQEDMMQMARVFAGFSLVEAEELRKGIAKKDSAKIAEVKRLFAEKARRLERDADSIEKVLEQIESSSRYSFNKSHSVSYGMLSYACAYFSANYPTAFFRNLINFADDEDDRVKYLSAAMTRDIKIFPPDVNLSSPEVTVEKDGIRLGLFCMRGVGKAYANKIVAERPYRSMRDVTTRLSRTIVATLHGAKALGSIKDADSFQPLATSDQGRILGISLSGLLSEWQDVADHIKAMPVHEATGESTTCLLQVVDVRPWKAKNGDMAFVSVVDVFGPKLDNDLPMFNSAWSDSGNDKPVKEGVYACVLNRLRNGNWCIQFINEAQGIREKMRAQPLAKTA